MYAIGQRWISEAETDLGLGLIQDVDFRMVTVYFPAIDDVRTYSKQNAPLSRVIFKEGDLVPLQDGTTLTVASVQQDGDIVFYSDGDQVVAEIHLSGQIQLNQPADRLFSGQIDNNNLFELRQSALQRLSDLRQRPFYGLLGGRTSLLPHQLYIAEQVTQDSIPRVLLADEVGLGKTIEAGQILHRLLLQQRISRVLVLVPDHLVHQWLVEMIRRFNLRFAIVNREALASNDQQADDDEAIENDELFAQDQLFICPMSLATREDIAPQIQASQWDMLIVDEAHHLEWQPDHQDAAYSLVEQLSAQTAGLMLLTATPEQLGVEGHFARLRLLDPQRYPSLQSFLDEQHEYQPIAELASALADGQTLNAELKQRIAQLLPDLASETDQQKLLDTLIDRCGPGRAMYRNTRHGVSGFPVRLAKITTLPCPDYASDNSLNGLFPEIGKANWVEYDPRCGWLLETLQATGKDKLVLICHAADTVLDMEAWLWDKHGIPAAVFHERMGLVERDRAAAYFADHEQGARILLCSEIGSEGRNFQFAHHLVLFDLPFNCDLIEQRIGRLDRIGQTQDIELHIPAFDDHISARWQHLLSEGLDVFSAPNPAAQMILEANRDAVTEALVSADGMDNMIEQLAKARIELLAELEQGRDRLLELHSCHPTRAKALAQEMTITHIEDEAELNDFIELFADAFGLDTNDLGNDCISIAPGDHMLVPDMPHLPEDGFMATTHRDVALSRDDVQFLSWEHPFIDQALELITSSPAGNASVAYLEDHPHNTGDCYIELQFVAHCMAPKALQVERYLPPNAMHLLMTPTGDLKVNEPHAIPGFPLPLKRGTARGLVEQKEAEAQPLIHKLEKMGSGQLGKMVERAKAKAEEAYEDRLARIKALSAHNKNIPASTLTQVEQEKASVLTAIEDAQLVLDSVRLIFCG